LAEHEPAGDLVTGGMSEAQMRAMYVSALGLDEQQADEMMAELWDAYCGELDVELRTSRRACVRRTPRRSSATPLTALVARSSDGTASSSSWT
jgi:hypothetical protein